MSRSSRAGRTLSTVPFTHTLILVNMTTPVIVGLGAVTAALVGRHLIRSGIIGKGAADQWVKGGFKAKMDRKEAIAILGLKCVILQSFV